MQVRIETDMAVGVRWSKLRKRGAARTVRVLETVHNVAQNAL